MDAMKASLLSLLFAVGLGHTASAAFPTLALKPVCKDLLHSVTTITNAGDGSGRIFMTEQHGLVRVFKGGMLLPTPFLDLRTKVVPQFTTATSYDERGLLGLAFHPDYEIPAQPGYRKFYVYYMATSNLPAGTDPVTGATNPVDCMSVIAEYQVSATNPDVADASTERIVMTFNQPQFNHNGGQLEFGPDGFLYIGSGDGGDGNDNSAGHTGGGPSQPDNNLGNSQDKTRLLGKILCIDPLGSNGPGGTYGIPAANPFVGAGGGVREEIYAYGLRNPWRFSFDVGTGGTNRLFCADVGQDKVEEVNLIISGGNYGWHMKEGSVAFSPPGTPDGGEPFLNPIAEYAHPDRVVGSPALPQYGTCVVGGIVYRGTVIPALQGKYIFGDWWPGSGFFNGVLLGLEETAPSSGSFTLSAITLGSSGPMVGKLQCLGRGEDGEIYVSAKTTTGAVQTSGGNPAGSLSKIVLPAGLALTHREAWVRQYVPLIGGYLDPKGDEDKDGIPNDVEYAYGYSPLTENDPKTGLSVSATFANDGAADLTMAFRRDALATDLTYKLQTIADMVTWNTITTSIAGAAATGSGATESTITGQLKLVSVNYHSSAAAPQQRFVRLLIERAP